MQYRKWIAIVLVVGGCGFHAVDKGDMGGNGGSGGSGGSGGTGGSGGSGGSTDMAGKSGLDGGVVDNTCALPQLIITVANVSNNGTPASGELVRLSLAGAAPTRCSTLKGQSLLGGVLEVATYLAPGFVLTADEDNVYLVDATRDVVAWTKPAASSGRMWAPLEAFPMKDLGGTDFAAIGFGMIGSSPNEMTEIDAWYADGSVPTSAPWCIQGAGCTSDLGLSLSILGVAANPVTPSHFYVVDNANNVAAWDVDPFTQGKVQFIGAASGYLQTAYAIAVGGKLRMAWLDAMAPTAVAYYNDTGGTASVNGPLRCQAGCNTILRVVPDPTSTTGFFALCDGGAVNGNTVVSLKSDGSCTTIFDGATLSSVYELTHIAIAQ